jgi:ribulose bisphosphate carboxylase small subunit
MDNPITPDVTPHTRDTLLEQLNFLIDGARSNLMDMKASLAIDGPLLKPETQYTKEQVIDMLKQAYNLGATAHEESMHVPTNSWSSGVDIHIDIEEGGFRYYGEAEVDSDAIKEAIGFKDHEMTDEQVEEILKA